MKSIVINWDVLGPDDPQKAGILGIFEAYWSIFRDFIDSFSFFVCVFAGPKAKMRLMKSFRETARHNIAYKSKLGAQTELVNIGQRSRLA